MLRVYRIPELEEVTKMVSDFANQFGDCNVLLGSANMCHFRPDKTVIMYTFPRMTQNGSDAFYDNFVSRYPRCEVFSQMFLSILHEIGHMVNKDNRVVEDVNVNSDSEYFALPNEMMATDWAGVYASNNIEECLEFDKRLNSKLIGNYMIFSERERMRIALDYASK